MNAIQEWTQALYNLSDQAFLSIMRNYLGPIKTPFHKPDLISRLIRLISGEQIKERMIALIDEQDRLILNAVALLDRPSIDDVYHFFAKDIEFYIIQQSIINLEERLLIFQKEDDSLHINPLLIEELKPEILHIRHLIDLQVAEQEELQPDSQYLFEQPFHIALLSLFASGKIRVNSDGSLRKTSVRTVGDVFPFLSEDTIPPYMQLLIGGLSRMGILERSHGTIITNDSMILQQENVSWKEYLITCIAQCLRDIFPMSRLSHICGFLQELFEVTAHIRAMGSTDFHRLWNIIASHHQIPLNETSEPFYMLRILGILYHQENRYSINPLAGSLGVPAAQDHRDEHRHVIIDSDFTITCDAGLELSASRFLYAAAKVITTDTHYQFELTKRSCIHAFDLSITLEQLIELLEQLSQTRLPHNILQTVTQWRQEYESLQIYSGIVIVANEHRRRIIEKHPSLQEHIIKTLAAGVFLFNASTERLWREVLISSGIEVLPKTRGGSPEKAPRSAVIHLDIGESQPFLISCIKEPFSSGQPSDQTDSSTFLQDLQQELDQKHFPRPEYEDLSARIDKKLILTHDQLITTYLHPSAAEAKGFDYQGKLNLCRQALASRHDLLEVHIRAFPDQEDVLLIRPEKLIKEGNNHILIGTTLPEHQEFSKSLRKIFLLRKLKSSLYSPLS